MTGATVQGELLYGEVTDAILAELRAGRQPDVAALARRYPDLAGQLDGHVAQLAAILRLAAAPGADPAGRSDDLPGQVGDFRLVREIGRGGMGVVFEAEQLSLRRRVALKVLPFAALLDPLRLQRFQHEAQAAARLHHPHIVPVFAVGCERGLHYYAMQLVDGVSAAALVRDLRQHAGRPAPPGPAAPPSAALTARDPSDPAYLRTVARWGRQAAEALHYAHEVGVVHRDVKPANLLLDGRGDLWVTDFGLARLRGGPELTATGDAVGTLRYMSPEQALGARGVADHRVDVYGLGATLYELLTLEPALPGQEREELLRRLLDDKPRPPRALNPALPFELETVVLKALRKEPAERYASARELADDLGRFLDGRPVHARRPTRRERARGWLRRHATGLTVAGGALVVLSTVLAVTTALTVPAYREAARKHAYAERSRQVARRAVDQVLSGVVLDWLEHEGPTEPAQRQLLEQLLACCQELAQEDAGDTEARLRLAQVCSRAAAIQARLGRLPEAQASSDRALALLDEAAGLHPDADGLALARAECLNGRGRLLTQRGAPAAAERACRAVVAALEPLLARHPDEPRYRYELARAFDQLGGLYHEDRTRLGEAATPFGRAVEHLTALSAADPGEPRYQYSLGHARAGQGAVFARTDQLERAEEVLNQAVEIYRRLHEGNRPSWLYREGLTFALTTLADVRNHAHRPREAEAPAREAVSLAADLDRDYPGVPTLRLQHARCVATLSDVLGFLGKPDEAGPLARQAVAIAVQLHQDVPGVPAHRVAVADAKMAVAFWHMNARRLREAEPWHAESVALLLQVLQDNPQDALAHYLFIKALPEVRGLQSANRSFAAAVPYQQALADGLQRLAERQPEDRGWRQALADTWNFLGGLHLCLGRPDSAEDAYRRELALREALARPSVPAQPEAAYALAWLLANCPARACRDPGRARDLAEQLLQTTPGKDLHAEMLRAAALDDLGRYREADRLMERMAKGAPDEAVDLWVHRATAQYHLGQRADACRSLGRAARRVRTWRKPLELDRLLLLAEVNALLGDPEPVLKLPPPATAAKK
jgi:serine/threonine protein kinase